MKPFIFFRLRRTSGKDRDGGWVLSEFIWAAAIMAVVAIGTLNLARAALEERQISLTERGIITLAEGLYSYRLNERQWPSVMSDLSAYAPTFSGGGRNGVGQPYTLVPPSVLNDPQAPIVIRTDLLEADLATRVAREFPNTGTVAGTIVSVEVPIPGHEPAQDSLLPRDGTRDMTGDLDMDGNTIADADSISSGSVTTDTVTSGTVASDSIASSTVTSDSISSGTVTSDFVTSDRVTTDLLSVEGQSLSGTHVSFLTQLAQLSCSGTQVLSISGGTPSCQNVLSTDDNPTPDDPPDDDCGVPEERPADLDSRSDWFCTKRYVDQYVNGSHIKTCSWNCRDTCGPGYSSGMKTVCGPGGCQGADTCEKSPGCSGGYLLSNGARCTVKGSCYMECRHTK